MISPSELGVGEHIHCDGCRGDCTGVPPGEEAREIERLRQRLDEWIEASMKEPPPALDNEKHAAWEWLRQEALGNAHAAVAIIDWTQLKRAAQPPSADDARRNGIKFLAGFAAHQTTTVVGLQDLLHDISATLESAKEFSSLHDMRAAMIQVLMSIGEYSTATKSGDAHG